MKQSNLTDVYELTLNNIIVRNFSFDEMFTRGECAHFQAVLDCYECQSPGGVLT